MRHTRFLLLLVFLFIISSVKPERARIFTPDDGLSNSHISQIYQDSQGYMWIATENGLNKFNGYSYTIYSEQANNPLSLRGNYVYSVLEDSRGIFWVGTMSGLFHFDRNTDSFHPFLINAEEPFYMDRATWILEDRKGNIWLSYPENGIIRLDAETLDPTFFGKKNGTQIDININLAYEDALGNLWLGTHDNGVFLFNTNNFTVEHFINNPSDPKSLSNNNVFSICEDTYGRIMIGTLGGGINIFDRPTRTFEISMKSDASKENQIFTICQDRNGYLWLGTDGSGVVRYDIDGNRLPSLDQVSDIYDLGKSKVHCIFEDQQGNMWIALYQKGILFLPVVEKTFKNYGFNPFNSSQSIGTHCVISVLIDSKENIWIGTDGDGLYKVNSADQRITHFTSKNTSDFLGDVITALYEDTDKNIWIGTYIHGLFRYNTKTEQFDNHYKKTNDNKGLSHNHVTSFIQEEDGTLWIGLSGGGINRLDISKKEFKKYLHENSKVGQNQLSGNWIYDLILDKHKKIWIGTSTGINILDPKTETFSTFKLNENYLYTNIIYTIKEDSKGNIWLGGFFGLYKIDWQTKEITHLTTLDGLPDNMINGIEEDDNNFLWVSTGKGLCRYDPVTGKTHNFYAEDGIQSNEFRRGSYYKGHDGRLYFGGINGLTTFMPSRLTYNTSLLRLAFSTLLIYNEPVEVGDKSGILTKTLDESESISLKYDQRSFTFSFAALEYGTPGRVLYYTQMENFDKHWRLVNNPNRSITYTNLDPGKYVFKVKATLDGENFLQREMQVIIQPPFWLSVWAKIIYAILSLVLLYAVYTYVTYRMQQSRILMEKEQQKELSESKLQFFTDISHEIRTPLTLIIGPLEKLMDEQEDIKHQPVYRIIHQNAMRILRLINQLMDLRAVEKGKLKLRVEKVSVEEFIRRIMESFDELAKTKQIDFDLILESDIPLIYVDKDCLDKIIFNLLSNAFKFTPKGGSIIIYLGTKNEELEIRVEDTGVGIDEESQKYVFDRFYQVRDKTNTKMGTGIGLHLSKMMAELHSGSIRVESQLDKGSKFIVILPLDKKVYKPEDFGPQHKEEAVMMFQPSFPVYDTGETPNSSEEKKDKFIHSVLVVEDDVDILNYIKTEMSSKYRIHVATNGKEGLNLALKYLPDIIISDIVMPEMDGLSLCKILKSNDKTCHIPIILLTAKTSVEQRIEGLEMGADSYIPKPFNMKHLETRINKLIQLRSTLKQKFTGNLDEEKEEMKIVSSDEKLLRKFNEKIKEQIGNPDLSVESISKDLGLSRVHLNRRLKSIINESPSTYIRNYRLQQAAWLLVNKKMTIAEVAYAVGFSSHAYFSNIFKEQFGMSPTEYIETNSED